MNNTDPFDKPSPRKIDTTDRTVAELLLIVKRTEQKINRILELLEHRLGH